MSPRLPELNLVYESRINKAIDFIRKNLNKNLALAEVAKVASFSEFHFHRIFADLVGETLFDYVWRLRAEKAVNMLHSHDTPIQEIAYQCGFSNQSNLAKALKKRYKMSPTQIRQHPELVQLGKTNEVKIVPGYHELLKVLDFNIRFQAFPERRIAYIRGITKGSDSLAIMLLWLRVTRWARRHHLYDQGAQNIGMMLDNPTLTAPHRCQYDAGVIIPNDFTLVGPVSEGWIPEGDYLVYEFEGTPQTLEELFYVIYRGWFPKSGYIPGDCPPLVIIHKHMFEKPRGLLTAEINVLLNPLA